MTETEENANELLKLRAEVQMWRSYYLDKPEDRLWHDSDQTWWCRKDNTIYGIGGLFAAEPPEAIKKLMAENKRLKSANKKLRDKLATSTRITKKIKSHNIMTWKPADTITR